MKLDKSIVDRRISLLEKQGVVFKTNLTVGKDIDFNSIVDSYDKVIVAVGTQKPRDIELEGRHLQNVIFALDYLKDSMLSEDASIYHSSNKHVVIVGGGDTATDCVATALRQHASSIVQLEITPQKPMVRHKNNPWPQWKDVHHIDYGHEEYIHLYQKDPRMFERTLTAIHGKKCVTSVDVSKVSWDDKGVHLTNERSTIPADLVIIAIGFEGLDQNASSWLKYIQNGVTHPFQTMQPNVYLAGDARRGQSLVVHAMEEGKQVAFQVHHDLMI